MLQHPQTIIPPDHWRQQMAQAVRTPRELLEQLELPAGYASKAADLDFPLRVPHSFIQRMRKGDINDPLLRQVLPLDEELNPQPGFSLDPVGDLKATSRPGILHKYHGRVLLMTTAACGIHCRYCFRRHFPYAEHGSRRNQWQEIAHSIAEDESLTEVILSGGDPLSLDNKPLGELLAMLDAIPHIKRIRIHSRFPIILPQRIDHAFLDMIGQGRTQKVLVIHSNHSNEIDNEVQATLKALDERDVQLFNQAVLLKGVNDSSDALVQLSERLFECRVIPYYLHLLDRVQGAAHFEVPEDEAQKIMTSIRRRLPGYLVPTLVREEAGVPFKRPV